MVIAIRFLRTVSEFLAQRKGLPVLVGAGLICLNFIVRLLPSWPFVRWLAATDLLLHLGAVVGLLGVLLGDAV
jgi:hypothetical protein